MGSGNFLSDEVKITKVADAQTAGTDTVNGTGVDMAGWDGVIFLTSFGTAAANNALHAEQSSDDGDSDSYTDLEGSEVDVGSSDEDQWVDVLCPQERYVRPSALRGTSSTLGDIWAIQYRGRSVAADNVTAGTINGKQVYHPDEGTK